MLTYLEKRLSCHAPIYTAKDYMVPSQFVFSFSVTETPLPSVHFAMEASFFSTAFNIVMCVERHSFLISS